MRHTRVWWAVLTKMDFGRNEYRLSLWGNGAQFQAPIFETRAEARAWANTHTDKPLRIVRCAVEYRT